MRKKTLKTQTARALKVNERDLTVKNTAYSLTLARINAESRLGFRVFLAAALAAFFLTKCDKGPEQTPLFSSAKQEVTRKVTPVRLAKAPKRVNPSLVRKCDFC